MVVVPAAVVRVIVPVSVIVAVWPQAIWPSNTIHNRSTRFIEISEVDFCTDIITDKYEAGTAKDR